MIPFECLDFEDILASEHVYVQNVSMGHFMMNQTELTSTSKSKASIHKEKKKKKKLASVVVPKHVPESHPSELFICHICQKSFSSKILLKKHVESHTKNTNNSSDNIPEHYKKFITENFDMTCDHCGLVLTSLRNARFHYRESHDEDMGYIKCCKIKLNKQYAVLNHINHHFSLSLFKYDLNCLFSMETVFIPILCILDVIVVTRILRVPNHSMSINQDNQHN